MLLRTAAIVFVVGTPFLAKRHLGRGAPTFTPLAKVELSEAAANVTTADAQAYDQLWVALDDLHKRASELGGEEFVRRSIERTAEYLDLEAGGELEQKFQQASEGALDDLAQARLELSAAEPSERQAASSAWQTAQVDIADRLIASLGTETPRQVLLAEERMRWLLRLDYGRR